MEVITRADGSVHVRLDTTPVKPKARPPAVDRYALQEAEDARRREAAERMEARRRARCSPKPPRTRAVDRMCARDGLRFTSAPRTPPRSPAAHSHSPFRSGPTPAPPAAAPAARGNSNWGEHGVPAAWPPNDEGSTGWWRRGQKLGLWGSDADGYPAERQGPDPASLRV